MDFFPANFMLQTAHEDEHHLPPTSLSPPFLSSSMHQDFHGVSPVLGKRSMSFSGYEVCEAEHNMEDDLSDDGLQLGEKKKRLNLEQVKTLEKNFELGNKLEPERKMQLARALGLQPRQIAIWFQNRRARWKTKQLEKDYEILKRQFDAVKQENDSLQAQNQKLHAQIMALKHRETTEPINLNKETEGSCSNRSENSFDIKLNMSPPPPPPPMDTPPSTAQPPTSRPLFNSSIRSTGAASQFFPYYSTRPDFQNQRMEVSVKEESLCSVFGIQDQAAGFWPWLEHQQYN